MEQRIDGKSSAAMRQEENTDKDQHGRGPGVAKSMAPMDHDDSNREVECEQQARPPGQQAEDERNSYQELRSGRERTEEPGVRESMIREIADDLAHRFAVRDIEPHFPREEGAGQNTKRKDRIAFETLEGPKQQ